MKLLILPFIMLCLLARAGAQTPQSTPKPTPPPGPLMEKRAPDFSTWYVSVRTGDAGQTDSTGGQKGSKKSDLPKYSVTKTRKILHVQFADDQRQIWNIWVQGTLIATTQPQGGDAQFVTPPGDPDAYNPLYLDFSTSDFPGFDWISARNYVGEKKVNGHDCLVFSANVKVLSDAFDAKGNILNSSDNKIACIDEKTRLPVALLDRNGIITYQFLAPPQVMQVLPKSISDMVAKQLAAEKAVAQLPSRPF